MRPGDDKSAELGTTDRTDDEIEEFNVKYLEENPNFDILTSNCQRYVKQLYDFLMERGTAIKRLPPMESNY